MTQDIASIHQFWFGELDEAGFAAPGQGRLWFSASEQTDSAVRVTHLPTGLVVECQDGRSQHRNKAQALAVLAARLKDAQQRAQHDAEAATRKSLVGSGDRSARIRTYNFPQGRVTDHRINLTLYKLDAVLGGALDELIDPLIAEHQAAQLAALADDGR